LGVGRVAAFGVGAEPGLAGCEFVGFAVGAVDADLAGAVVEFDPPGSFVDP